MALLFVEELLALCIIARHCTLLILRCQPFVLDCCKEIEDEFQERETYVHMRFWFESRTIPSQRLGGIQKMKQEGALTL